MFNKILIANRGEIACRIIKTCHKLGIKTVAVYSTADKDALFVKNADEAFCIGPPPAQESYLNIDKIIHIAKKQDVEAIHPGYGFLSENVDFARRLEKENIVFIGPNIDAIELMGSKSNAKTVMEKAGVPVTPGYHGDKQDDKTLLEAARQIGFPVLLKAAAGGGGKGMRVVDNEADFLSALSSAKRESQKSFNDDKMLIETYLSAPRHIEVQVFADTKGNTVHLFERDCSIQRRHQKIIEEAPATNIPDTIKSKLYEAAINAARAVNYVGAGTIEFLYSDDAFYFMEMNTRLQVEHPVTEMITGLDLVEWQLRVANNETLPLKQEEIKCKGHAIEVRLYAEDTNNQFLPQTGKIEECHWPKETTSTRIDTGIAKQSEIGIHYDPMIAKLITHAPNRDQAIQTMIKSLNETCLTGITHNRLFLMNILGTTSFQKSLISTNYLNEHPPLDAVSPPLSLIAASLFPLLGPCKNPTPWEEKSGWQMNLAPTIQQSFLINDISTPVKVMSLSSTRFQVEINHTAYDVIAQRTQNKLKLQMDGIKYDCQVFQSRDYTDVVSHLTDARVRHPIESFDNNHAPKGQLTAPMPGNIVAILCKEDDKVEKGQTLMIIEAMKMEHSIHASSNAVIKSVFFDVGSQVNEGDELLALESDA